VVDGEGNPHASYCTGVEAGAGCTEVCYAYRQAGVWHTQLVDSSSEYGASSIDLYANGRPGISYYDKTNGDLIYASQICLGPCIWFTEVVDSVGDVGDRSSLKIAPDGSLHISYHDLTSRGLRYATYAVFSQQRTFLPLLIR
jgi:hypothetical protein